MSLFSRLTAPADRWVVVGLGNPGDRYEGTRHNAGAMTVDLLLDRSRSTLKRHKSGVLAGEGKIADERVILARPLSYMNESGRPVRELLRWYKVGPENLIVVHDEIDLSFGDVRVKSGGGTAGHNGLASLVSHLGTRDFARVRVGVSRPSGRREAAGHVLSDFSPAQRKELPFVLERAADAVERIVEAGVERAMNEFNTRE
jgi:peptidyl-tRNA hydrolase, PTH1 family